MSDLGDGYQMFAEPEFGHRLEQVIRLQAELTTLRANLLRWARDLDEDTDWSQGWGFPAIAEMRAAGKP